MLSSSSSTLPSSELLPYLSSQSSTLLSKHYNLTCKDLTKELWSQYSSELMTMIVSQYFNKDPSSRGLSYEQLYKYFKDEYDQIFTNDVSFVHAFLYFNQEGRLVGTFMFRDAVIYVQTHRKILQGMKPTDSFYDYYLQFCLIAEGYFNKFNVKKGECLYGTNLAFSAEFLESLGSAKNVLNVILATFIDKANWWREKAMSEKVFPYSMWTQFRKSLITTTKALFNCLGDDDFKFVGGDNVAVEGKLFFVTYKKKEDEMKLWAKAAKL